MIKYCLLPLLLLLTSCGVYSMPCDDDFSTVPLTNNPNVTRDRGQSLCPGLGKG